MSIGSALPRTAGYRELIRENRNFRFLWFGQIISLLGDWFDLIASAALIAALGGSGLAVGGLFVVRALAPFAVTPLAGVAADRYNRKWLLMGTDLSRAVVVMGFLLVRQPSQLWLLYVLTAAQLGLSGFAFPARNAILPDIVKPHELGTANVISSSTWSVMLAFGAALGGVATGRWGVYPSFVIDSLTFLASAALTSRVLYRPHEGAGRGGTVRGAVSDYLEGLRYLRRHRDILVIATHKAAFAMFVGGAYEVLQVKLAEKVFIIGHEGGTGLGLMYAMSGVGTGLGPILVRRFTGDDDRRQRLGILLGYGMLSVALIVMAPLVSFPVLLIGIMLRGAAGGINWVFSTQLLLQLVPRDVRGRVFSSEYALFTLGYSIGATLGGWLLESAGLSISHLLWLMTALVVLPGVFWGWWIARRSPVAALPSEAGR